MIKECYVIYVLHTDKPTGLTESVSILACVKTEEKARGFLRYKEEDAIANGEKCEWINERTLSYEFGFDTNLIHYISYEKTLIDFD